VDGARISFLEAKPIDWTRIRALLAESDRLNHWANFGPVAQRLESTLEDLLGLSSSKAIVATSSGTAALFASAGNFAARLRHPPRWVTSAFGFVSTRAGPFANTQFVDCDGRGFLSLGALADVPSDTYDAVLVTNVFAAQATFTPYADVCRANGKALLVDNAMALFGVDRASNCVLEEIGSLHHTKPWGFGEGGFAIVSRDDAPLIRNLLWCGKEAPPPTFPLLGEMASFPKLRRLSFSIGWKSASCERQPIENSGRELQKSANGWASSC
jgi:dTDP-4-amino-4,6-dideoxygalactose transaminase